MTYFVSSQQQGSRAVVMKLVIVESPFAGDVEENLRYLRAAMHDCFLRGEAPFASHAIYTQPGVLDDNVPAERMLGIEAGLFWASKAEKTVVYTDLGISSGMRYGILNAEKSGRTIDYRTLPGWDDIGKHSRALGAKR